MCSSESTTAESVQRVYRVAGMSCGGCAAHVSRQIAGVAGVSHVSVDLATGAVTVTSGTDLDDGAVGAAVTRAGYRLVR